VVIVAVNVVLGARFAVGVNVSVVSNCCRMRPDRTRQWSLVLSAQKVVELIVAGFIAVLNVALTI
jgi:hypothetical protein